MRKTLFHVEVEPTEHVLHYAAGQCVEVLAAGRHPRRWGHRYCAVDATEQLLQLAAQEVPCADGIHVRVTSAVRWRIIDALTHHERGSDPDQLLYLATQVALRAQLAGVDSAEVAQAGRASPELVENARAEVADKVAGLGIEVIEVVVRDITLPAEIRQAMAQVVVARHQGQARLEAARAETASLRSLANGAKLLEEHPALARIKLVEAAGHGSKLVIKQQG